MARDRLLQGMADGLHIGAQLYVSLHGEVVADGALGEARDGVPMRPDTVMRWLSAGKPVAAVAISQLAERGFVEYDRAVAEYVPEFEQGGKGAVTLRHVLTHTGGFRTAESAASLPTWEERIAAVNAAPLEPGWVPGQKAGYHPASSWLILGEIVRRVSGAPYEDYVRKEVFEPQGMTGSWATASPELVERYGGRWGELYLTENGQRTLHPVHSTEASGYVCRPGSTLRGPASELGRFYEMLLNGGALSLAEGGVLRRPDVVPSLSKEPAEASPGAGTLDGERVISAESAALITTLQRVGMFDETFKHVMDWGLGVIIDSKRYGPGVPYGYGQHASPQTFGHGGSQSSVGFADPERRLVVAAIFNGLPGEARHDRRLKRVTAAIYEDLGLAPDPHAEQSRGI